jgi:hypothetical protein
VEDSKVRKDFPALFILLLELHVSYTHPFMVRVVGKIPKETYWMSWPGPFRRQHLSQPTSPCCVIYCQNPTYALPCPHRRLSLLLDYAKLQSILDIALSKRLPDVVLVTTGGSGLSALVASYARSRNLAVEVVPTERYPLDVRESPNGADGGQS